MLKCPKCGTKIPFWKPWLLTRNHGITCSSCGQKLFANRKINVLIGAIGGGVGALCLINLFNSDYSFWPITIVVLWILGVLLAASLLTKLETKR